MMGSSVGEFFFGLTAVFYGLGRIFADRRLRAWAIFPMLVAILVFLVLGVAGFIWLVPVVPEVATAAAGFLSFVPGGVLWWIVLLGLWPLAIVALGFSLYLLTKLIVAPFYSILAERALIGLGVRPDHRFNVGEWMAIAGKMLLQNVLKTVIFAFVGLILFAASFVPIINLLATIGFVHMVAFDVADFGFEAMEWKLADRFRHFRTYLASYSGFAFGLGALMLIPGLSLLLLPAAVVGSCAILKRNLSLPTPSERTGRESTRNPLS